MGTGTYGSTKGRPPKKNKKNTPKGKLAKGKPKKSSNWRNMKGSTNPKDKNYNEIKAQKKRLEERRKPR